MVARAGKLVGYAVFGLVIPAIAATPASAQARAAGSKWDVEFHVGVAPASTPTGGTPITSFPVGAPVATASGPSRAVSSWYFGDGAKLLNDASAALGVSQRIAALDPTLQSASAGRPGGPTFGARVTRRLSPRLSVEGAFDVASTPLQFTDAARLAITAASDSFESGWTAAIDTGATSNIVVTSDATVTDGTGRQTFVTGAMKFHLPARGRLSVYALAGAGGVFSHGDAPSATLSGRYRFTFVNTFPLDESDNVSIRVVPGGSSAAAIFGGGFDYGLSSKHALRFDARVMIAGNPVSILVDASPSVQIGDPAFAISTPPPSPIQFSNNPASGRTSSLSGPAITGLETFTGSGTSVRLQLSVGYVFRF